MAEKKGPSKGSRILVELPKELADPKKGNLIAIKQGVAKVLGFDPVTKIPRKEVKFKTAAGERTREVLQSGAYRRRSVKLIFKQPQKIPGTARNFKTVSMPIPTGTSIADVVEYFSSGKGKSKGIIALVTPAGKRIQWGESE